MIKTDGITKCFTGKQVLSDISLDIGPGKIFGLLGPSGAGKTTLIRIITGQLAPDGGNASILGKKVSELTDSDKRQIGIMMDGHGVYDRLSCTENLKIFADIYRIPYEKIGKTLKEVGLEDAAGKPAMKLSKGMRARLQLARVFMVSPKILFLDEPTSGLDPATMRYIHKLILERRDAGCTIFLTTHNMEEASVLCDEIALLNDGVIVDRGTPADLCRRYDRKRAINLHLKSGEDISLSLSPESADLISTLLKQGNIETVHSSEPTLENVFIELTGKKLESDEEAGYV